MTNLIIAPPSQDSKNIAMLTWIGTIFFGFIPSLAVYLAIKNDAYVREHSVEALNWSITILIGYAIAWVLTLLVIGFLALPVLYVCNVVFCIMGALAAYRGESFRLPFALRLVR